MTSYQPKEIPLDTDGFTLSFSLDDALGIQSFFDEFGFVVVDSVLSESECADAVNDIWLTIERFCGGKLNIQRDNPPSWIQKWPGGGPGLLGQALTPAAWRNRTNPNVRTVFERIVGRTDLLCSVDNYGVLRPTRRVPMHQLPPQAFCRTNVCTSAAATSEQNAAHATEGSASTAAGGVGEVVDMDSWKTTSKWLHWDLSPFHWVNGTMPSYTYSPYTFISENNGTCLEPGAKAKVQGLLNLIDARVVDGGFTCVPGFHKQRLAEWAALPENETLKADMKEAFEYLEVPQSDPIQGWTKPVPMRAGSLLVWSSELPHCNFPNDSDRFRMVQYVKCFPRHLEHPPAAQADSADNLLVGEGEREEEGRGSGAGAVAMKEEEGREATGGAAAAFGGSRVTPVASSTEKTRREMITEWVARSLSPEQVAALTDDQRAILDLQDYGSN